MTKRAKTTGVPSVGLCAGCGSPEDLPLAEVAPDVYRCQKCARHWGVHVAGLLHGVTCYPRGMRIEVTTDHAAWTGWAREAFEVAAAAQDYVDAREAFFGYDGSSEKILNGLNEAVMQGWARLNAAVVSMRAAEHRP